MCRQNEIKVQEAVRSSKNTAARHIRKLVTAAYQRNVKAYLDRWRSKNSLGNA